ncbi:MAG: glutathione S-transferase family protein [Caulobacter sp.]|nr:glutathione S-transferase family protein [Caulobacter sp.]
MTTTPILHHYDTSPFSEKVRLLFGLKGLAWSSVEIPVIMPKPDYTPLTGGYRRTPSLQIGADVYCDTQVILAELEARYPDPPALRGGLDWAINLWADRLFFQTTVPVIFGALGDNVPADFIKDREALSGRPFDTAAMKSVAPALTSQWRAQAAWIEDQLAFSPWLSGAAPGLADISAYMNVWFLGRSLPHLVERFTQGMTRLHDWQARVAALGHGTRTELSGPDALEIARAADPAPGPAHDAANPQDLTLGQAVMVMADDYGRDPIRGTLVAAALDRTVIAREDSAVGTVHVHFPKTGYLVFPS